MKYIVKITKWNQIKIHEFINFFFPPNEKILTISRYGWLTILLVYCLSKVIQLLRWSRKETFLEQLACRKKRKRIRKCENGSGEKVFCLGREHDCRIYSVDLRAPCFYEYTEKTMGNTKLLRSYEAPSSQVASDARQKKDGVERKC